MRVVTVQPVHPPRSFHAISDSMNHVNVSVAQNPGLARIWVAGSAGRSSLSEEERYQYDLVLLSYFHVFETMHYQCSHRRR